MTAQLFLGDCLDVMKSLPDSSIDSIVTDPPYGLSFMGKIWDHGVPTTEIWSEAYRVLKPGGHLLAFSGTRTYHRATVAIEDAGFDIRDMISWLYGSGFPKSHNVAKGIDATVLLGSARTEDLRRLRMGDNYEPSGKGRVNYDHGSASVMDGEVDETCLQSDEARQWEWWGTSLKPACEPITLARKPFSTTVAANVIEHGTAAINIDGCRIESSGGKIRENEASQDSRYNTTGSTNFAMKPGPRGGDPKGRWPANVMHDGSDEVEVAFAAFGERPSGKANGNAASGIPSNGSIPPIRRGTLISRHDTGTASRFFYCAKTAKSERDGCTHPTMKPIKLMEYLCRLVTPPGGTVLDPFAGSGTTGIAAVQEGFNAILIEREQDYVEMIKHRFQKRGLELSDVLLPEKGPE